MLKRLERITGIARAKNWPKDFDRKGVPFLNRLGKAPAAVIMYPIICGGYQCHGQDGTDRGLNPIKSSDMSIPSLMEENNILVCDLTS